VPYPLEALIKIIVAVIFGGVVGWQREARFRPAGLRTHVLVCVGSAVYTLASVSFSGNSDPSRIASQVATGMGFLGAGTIIRHGSIVRGLTTAASLWTVAAIGICVAIGGRMMWVAAIATIVTLITLTLLRKVERQVLGRGHFATLVLALRDARSQIGEIQRTLQAKGIRMDSAQITEGGPGGVQELEISIRVAQDADLSAVLADLGRMEGFVSLQQE
jgi:putative Mg2+ transporter-C (MgtC) family protein